MLQFTKLRDHSLQLPAAQVSDTSSSQMIPLGVGANRTASSLSGNKWNFWTITTFVQLCGREPAAPPQEHRAHKSVSSAKRQLRAHTHTSKHRLLRSTHSRGEAICTCQNKITRFQAKSVNFSTEHEQSSEASPRCICTMWEDFILSHDKIN